MKKKKEARRKIHSASHTITDCMICYGKMNETGLALTPGLLGYVMAMAIGR
jgi:hypothetical protein